MTGRRGLVPLPGTGGKCGKKSHWAISNSWALCASELTQIWLLSVTKMNGRCLMLTFDFAVNFDFSLFRLPAKARRMWRVGHMVCWQHYQPHRSWIICWDSRPPSALWLMAWEMRHLDRLHLYFDYLRVDPCVFGPSNSHIFSASSAPLVSDFFAVEFSLS